MIWRAGKSGVLQQHTPAEMVSLREDLACSQIARTYPPLRRLIPYFPACASIPTFDPAE
jgi:hypothetical protein